MIKGKTGFTTCFDRQAGEVSKVSAHGMFSDFLFQTTTYAVRGEAYGSSKMTTYNVRGEASKGLSIEHLLFHCDTLKPFLPVDFRNLNNSSNILFDHWLQISSSLIKAPVGQFL